jgi:hypothetical protein
MSRFQRELWARSVAIALASEIEDIEAQDFYQLWLLELGWRIYPV